MSQDHNNFNPPKIDVTHRKNREMQNIIDSTKVLYIIKNHLIKHPLYIKGYPKKFQARITKIVDDRTIELILPPGVKAEDDLTIYSMLNKFVEIDLSYQKDVNKHIYQFQISGSNIAKTGRDNVRFKLDPGDAFIKNIKTSKNIIQATEYTIPTTVKVIMYKFEPQLKSLANDVKLTSIDRSNPKHKFVEKTLKTYYVRDTLDEKSYDPPNDAFIDIRKYLNNDLTKAMRHYEQKKIKSEIISPVIYLTLDEKPIPLGIIHMISHNKILGMEKVVDAKEISYKIVDNIRVANTVTIKKRQTVVDIGMGGAKFLISDNELAGMLMQQEGLVFDLYFRMQAPITLLAKIRNFHHDEQNQLIIGVDFQGHSSRKEEMKRLGEILRAIEKEYKEKLT